MGDIDSTSGASAVPRESIADETRLRREAYIKGDNGDAIGNNWVAPKADFGKFLGYKNASPEELKGDKPLSGSRVIELALQKEAQDLGMRAAVRGNQYRNIAISWGRFNNEPGRERDMIKDGIDAIRQSSDKNATERREARLGTAKSEFASAPSSSAAMKASEAQMAQMSPAASAYIRETRKMQKESHNDNIKYLEMQYRFQEMGKQEGVISNLMKARHDNISRMIRGNQG